MVKKKLLVTDSIYDNLDIEEEILKESGINFEIVIAPDTKTETLKELASDCDAMMVTYAQVGKEVIDNCKKCKVMVRNGIGFANIDVDSASENGIMVANVLNYCIDEVADHAMALMLACLRKVVILNKSVQSEHVWDMNLAKPMERISNLTLGLWGFGNIARATAKRAQAFGMTVLAYDPYLSDDVFEEYGVTRCKETDTLISQSDVLSIHLQLNKETEKIVNKNAFEKMKPNAFLINVSRGGLIDEKALAEAISSKQIAGCGLDVMESEPGDMHSSLMTFDNVIVTPHAAFYSETANLELRKQATRQIVRSFTEGKPEFWVNRSSFNK